MSEKNYTLFLILLNGCVACKKLKSILSDLKKEIKDKNLNVKIVEYEKSKNSDDLPKNAPKALVKFDFFFWPMLVLVPTKYVNENFHSGEYSKNVCVFGAKFSNGKIKMNESSPSISQNNLIKWIKRCMIGESPPNEKKESKMITIYTPNKKKNNNKRKRNH